MKGTKSMKARATLRTIFQSKRQLQAIASALEPELHHPAGEKANARLLIRGKKLTISFEAKDSTALRAIMSSYLRMLRATINVSESLMKLEHARKPRKSDKQAG